MRGSSEVAMLGNLELAIIGCGAIADSYYFPVLSADASARDKVWLVEPSVERREKAAAAFGLPARRAQQGQVDGLTKWLGIACKSSENS